MEVTCTFDEVRFHLDTHREAYGEPVFILIRKENEEQLHETFPAFYNREGIKEAYSTGYLGYFFGIPVKHGVVLSRNMKLVYEE